MAAKKTNDTIAEKAIAEKATAEETIEVKATTEEGLGFTGEGLGIACQSIALLEEI